MKADGASGRPGPSSPSMERLQRVASYALLVNEGRLLLCRIADGSAASGRWTLPGGGIDFGEHPRDACIREVREETGLEVEVTGLAAVDSERFSSKERELHAIRILYWASARGTDLVAEQGGSTDQCRWVSPEEARRLPLVRLARVGLELIDGRL